MEPPSFSSITNIVDTPTDQMKRMFHNITLGNNTIRNEDDTNNSAQTVTNKDKDALLSDMKTKHLDDEFGNNRASKRIKRTTTLFENVTIHQVAQDIDEQLGESTHTKLLNGIKQERPDEDDHDDDDETIISNISCHSITPERLTAAVNIDWVTLGKLSNSQYLRHYKGQPEILRRGGIYISY